MRTRFALALSALLAVLAAPAAHAGSDSSLRCPGGIVSGGDLKIDVLGKCGAPTLKELSQREEVGVVRREDSATKGAKGTLATSRRETTAVERWTYDFGRNQFIRIVSLEGGRVRSVETGGRGYSEETAHERPPLPVATCDYKGIRVGDDSYELRARCGEPATRDVRLLERAVSEPKRDETVERSVTVAIEVWAYHFGPQTLTRVVELEAGKVVRVDTGGHGYAPP